jgi:hypothetical protein
LFRAAGCAALCDKYHLAGHVVNRFKGTSKNSRNALSVSFPRKRESKKIKQLDSPIMMGNDKKMNNEKFPSMQPPCCAGAAAPL